MADENPKVSRMDEELQIPKIPALESQEKDFEEQPEEKSVKALQTITTKLKETVKLEMFLPQIYLWIEDKLKIGPTLVIGNNIGDFAISLSSKVPSVIARESTSTYVSPVAEVTDASQLEKIDFKPFDLGKIESMQNVFLNIIVIFTLRKLEREKQKLLLRECKRMLSRDGQLIVIDEFYPKSIFLIPITIAKEGIRSFRTVILKKQIDKPIKKIDKLAEDLELKFFDVKYDAGGRVRTYVLTKRWGALVS